MNVSLLIDVFLCLSCIALVFGFGVILGMTKVNNRWEKMHTDILVQHVREMDAIKKKVDESEGEGWKHA